MCEQSAAGDRSSGGTVNGGPHPLDANFGSATVYDALNRAYTTSYPVDYNFSAIPFQQANQTAWTIHSTADGEPLYTTDYQGNITDIKLSAYGEIFPFDSLWKGPVMYHRDMFGFTASAHTNASSSNNTGWTLPTPYSSCSASGNLGATPGQEAQKVPAIPQCLGACACIVGYQFRTDGYFDGSLTWRGVRNYTDSTQQWTTPDSYAGNAANPITGMTYNYGNNNPLRFSDPSGLTGVACDPPAPWDGHSPVESRAADCLPGEDGGDSGGGTSDGPSCSESSCMGYAGDNYLVNAGPLGSITLYRGVTAWELEDILKNSNYYRVGKGLEGKYFFETPGQVSKFAQARSAMGDNEGPFTLTSAVFNEPLNADVVELSAAEGGNALFLRGEPLETLSSNPVTVYDSMPLPEVMPNIWEMPDVFIDL